ncbi:C type lectin containing domain protein [Penaeus vannamei]|uniref:C type lectin containing domain protein n=1 Tax=Penaeus vannamei TaxID=6689 RepID=A0A423U245_PENVA|nr:C type lectin containing domain protein [Penaeus vannamei]
MRAVWRKTGCGYGGTRLCQRGRGQTCLSPREYCEAPCDDKDERLCQVNVTIEHPDCPHLYTRVGDHCLSIFFFGLVNWGEARAFCKMNGGDLLSFQDGFENFYEITATFTRTVSKWSGHHLGLLDWGAVRNKTWTWVDGNPIELGTPYWSLRYDLVPPSRAQVRSNNANEPCLQLSQPDHQFEEILQSLPATTRKPTVGMCTALNFENFFYMSDEDCLAKKSPLCVAGKEPSERA